MSFRIETSGQVLDQIRLTAVEGYHRVPHGGVETGGILYGTHSKTAVRVKAWRPIECEYSKGPSFLLSETEAAALAETLKNWREDPELARLEPVGWYRAHTRSEILLSEADVAFFNRFFPQAWQVGLIVRPASFAPTRGGYFFREEGGSIRTQSSYREFTMSPAQVPRRPPPPDPLPVPEIPAAPLAAEPAEIPPAAAEPLEPATEPAKPEPAVRRRLEIEARPYVAPRFVPRSDSRRRWYAAAALVVILLVAWLAWPSRRALSLSATDLRGQLRISWDRNARSVTQANGGSIEIVDRGARTEVHLSPADLRSGSVFYERQSGDVSVRLTVNVPGAAAVSETTHFLRPGELAATPPTKPDAGQKSAPPVVAKAKLERDNAPVSTAPKTVQPAASQAPPAKSPATPAVTERQVIAFHAPPQRPQKSAAEIPAIAPPRIDSLPATPPAGLPSVLGQDQHPIPAPVAPQRAAASPAAARGRIIWTGKLSRNARLTIERNHASAGSIVGSLPASLSHVSAFPGDLTSSGITLFTADPRYTQPVTEKAGADNGWNSTTYTWDPKRASGIRIEEQPTAQNGFKLVLQCDIPKLSVLMIDWRTP